MSVHQLLKEVLDAKKIKDSSKRKEKALPTWAGEGRAG